MGWCSATRLFDAVAEAVLEPENLDKKALLKSVVQMLENEDWDCQGDSSYYDHPIVQEIFQELHPYWFEDDE